MDSPAGGDIRTPANVAGNARITGGTMLIAFVIVKIASTTYRFLRYYAGQPEYARKGPPPLMLRLLGPIVTLTTVAVLATGVGSLVARHARWLDLAHKASFVVWFAATTIHVLGHAIETPALAFADWSRSRRAQVSGASKRVLLFVVATAGGLLLATLSLGWTDHWRHFHHL
jgi:hypothetical protein